MTNAIELEYVLNKMRITKKEFATLLGISLQALYNKLNNKVEFKASEIIKACKVLQLADTDRDKIFFAVDVDYKSTQKKMQERGERMKEVTELIKLIRQLDEGQKTGILMITDALNLMIASKKKRRITRRSHLGLL